MALILKGDRDINEVKSSKAKALKVNLNKHTYGTFAEIGAGQETVRHFFRAGGASGTIAKAMSAYDKDFSDAIYGIEEDGRYVTENRLKKMLTYEVEIIEDRLSRKTHPNNIFFTYANTVTTIDFVKRFKGHGWVGIRFSMDDLQLCGQTCLTTAKVAIDQFFIVTTQEIAGSLTSRVNEKFLVLSLYLHCIECLRARIVLFHQVM